MQQWQEKSLIGPPPLQNEDLLVVTAILRRIIPKACHPSSFQKVLALAHAIRSHHHTHTHIANAQFPAAPKQVLLRNY